MLITDTTVLAADQRADLHTQEDKADLPCGQGRAGQGRAEQGRAEQGRTGQGSRLQSKSPTGRQAEQRDWKCNKSKPTHGSN